MSTYNAKLVNTNNSYTHNNIPITIDTDSSDAISSSLSDLHQYLQNDDISARVAKLPEISASQYNTAISKLIKTRHSDDYSPLYVSNLPKEYVFIIEEFYTNYIIPTTNFADRMLAQVKESNNPNELVDLLEVIVNELILLRDGACCSKMHPIDALLYPAGMCEEQSIQGDEIINKGISLREKVHNTLGISSLPDTYKELINKIKETYNILSDINDKLIYSSTRHITKLGKMVNALNYVNV